MMNLINNHKITKFPNSQHCHSVPFTFACHLCVAVFLFFFWFMWIIYKVISAVNYKLILWIFHSNRNGKFMLEIHILILIFNFFLSRFGVVLTSNLEKKMGQFSTQWIKCGVNRVKCAQRPYDKFMHFE